MTQHYLRDSDVIEAADRLPVLPLRDVVLFPHVVMPLLVGRAGSLAALEAAEAGDKLVLLVTQRDSGVQDPTASDLYRIGTLGRVLQFTRLPNGAARALVEGLARAHVSKFVGGTKLLRAVARPHPYAVVPGDGVDDEARKALALFDEYVAQHRRLPPEVTALVQSAGSLERQGCGIAAHLAVRHETRQTLLEAPHLVDLFRALTQLTAGETELLRLERKIEDEVRGSLFQNQREFYLQEQLRAIRRELGDEEGDELADLETELKARALPEQARARADRELRRLRRMSPMAPEATVARNYLDWLAALPWTERTDDLLDVTHARAILDEDHFGLDEVKERIVDYIAVLSLVGRLEGPILCLVGPPGVGKTSLGRSIARVLGRKFVRMSLGGVRDEAEIRGHRRTYIGALPGRIIQAMRRAESVNPVILLDEVDKLGNDWRGDPSAALLEVLDPEQNRAFNDHFLELDYDLSQVLFLTTANSLGGIPEPLRDRMEIIRLPGYLDQEKFAIAQRYLIPRQLTQHGIDPASVTWAADALPALLRQYTREAGVRELERRIARLSRKLARRRAGAAPAAKSTGAPHDRIAAADLRALLGVAPYDADEVMLEDRVGVAQGLAYTQVGGELLEVEVSVVPGRGRMLLTGTLGDVMKESASAALSYIRSRAELLGVPADFARTRDVHVHLPAGATPKDGPSAGIALAAAIVSALTGTPVRGDVAMTGEITLRGRVLPIGGLKEKAVAAHRHRVKHVVLPAANLRDLEELPAEVRTGVEFHPVKTMDEVLALALRAIPVAAPRPARGARKGAAANAGVAPQTAH
ncbi:MAG: endopeptidase La [Gemmatimonadetes bacterium]|nr:endopeptidase La [Gemmatimonadota bacterium]